MDNFPAGNPLNTFALDRKKKTSQDRIIYYETKPGQTSTDLTLRVLVVQMTEEFASVNVLNGFSRVWLYTVYI